MLESSHVYVPIIMSGSVVSIIASSRQSLQLGNITKGKDIHVELITGTISFEGKKKMLIGSFYRPPILSVCDGFF
jgi:hypothetical protein